jgi:divalent metal cation (Fe/Co/Zn/Cd) transporter
LEADALHFYTDIYTGGAVLLGLGAVWLSEVIGWPLLARADAAAALLVVVVLLRMTLQLGRHAVDVLLDSSHELTKEVNEVARAVPGVERVHSVRTRQVGPQSFVDMRIDVARSSSFEESHAIATAVEQAVHDVLPRADVVVHVDPVRPEGESLVQAIHAIAQREGLPIHHVTLHNVAGRVVAHLHVELPPSMTLGAAHARVDAFERQVLQELSELSTLLSHIEPRSEEVAEGPDVTARAASVIQLVEQLARDMSEVVDCHDISVQRVAQSYHISLHCTFEADADLELVHEAMARLERRLRNAIPSLGRVVIHPEPLGE